MVIFTRETSKGTLTAELSQGMGNTTTLKLVLNGKQVVDGVPGVVSRTQAAKLPKEFTHILGAYPLRADEIAAYDAARKAQPRTVDLRRQREMLALTLQGAQDEERAAKAAAWDAGNETAAVAGTSQTVKDAEAALADFDATHPEVVAAIRQEKAEMAERNRWM